MKNIKVNTSNGGSLMLKNVNGTVIIDGDTYHAVSHTDRAYDTVYKIVSGVFAGEMNTQGAIRAF